MASGPDRSLERTPSEPVDRSVLTAKADAARKAISGALGRHGHGALMFSGGKDSVTLAHLAEPWKDRIELVWVNTQGHLPHTVEFVRSYGKRFRLVEMTSNYAERFLKAGPPSMIVPVYNTKFAAITELEDQERFCVSDWISCCAELRWKPMDEYFAANRHVSLVIHGQRKDENAAVNMGAIEALLPLWNWTTAEVLEYVKLHDLLLPEQYAQGVKSSLDCGACCTARLDAPYRAWLKGRYPEISRQLATAITAVYGTVAAEWEKLQPGFDVDGLDT